MATATPIKSLHLDSTHRNSLHEPIPLKTRTTEESGGQVAGQVTGQVEPWVIDVLNASHEPKKSYGIMHFPYLLIPFPPRWRKLDAPDAHALPLTT